VDPVAPLTGGRGGKVGRGPRRVPPRWIRRLPDRLTLLRMLLLPLLWLLAATRDPRWVGIGVALAAFTDVVDGPLARGLRTASARGSRLDSVADHLLTASVAIWLAWLRPEFVAAELPLLGGWLLLGGATLLVGWLKFHRVGDLHLYSAKAAGTAGYLFAIWLLIFGDYARWVFHLVIALCFIATLESLAVILRRDRVDEHVGTVFRRN
jgi:phosphatidylglycerophosphate synthase